MLPWLIPTLASAASGILGANAASDAARQQADAIAAAQAQSRAMYEQGRADLAPWRETGAQFLGTLAGEMGTGGRLSRDFTMADFQTDPGYNFRLQEAQRALDSAASARGGFFSGGQMQALQGVSQNMASDEFTRASDRFNANRAARYGMLSGIAGMGQNAASQGAQLGAQYSGQMTDLTTAGGQARAAGTMGGANALLGGLGGALTGYMYGQGYGGYGAPAAAAMGGPATPTASWLTGGGGQSPFLLPGYDQYGLSR